MHPQHHADSRKQSQPQISPSFQRCHRGCRTFFAMVATAPKLLPVRPACPTIQRAQRRYGNSVDAQPDQLCVPASDIERKEAFNIIAVSWLSTTQQQPSSVKLHVGTQHPSLTHFACLDLFSLPKSISVIQRGSRRLQNQPSRANTLFAGNRRPYPSRHAHATTCGGTNSGGDDRKWTSAHGSLGITL